MKFESMLISTPVIEEVLYQLDTNEHFRKELAMILLPELIKELSPLLKALE